VRRSLLPLAALIVASALPARASSWGEIWRSESASARTSVAGRARTRILMGERVQEAVAEVLAAGGKARLDYQTERRRWSLLDDGRSLIRLDPGRRVAVVLPRPPLAVDRSLAERNYVARVAGESQVAGRPTRIFEVSPRHGGAVVFRLWLDRDTGFALKRERYNVEGKLTSGTEYLQITFGAQVPPDAFSIPPDWRQVDLDGSGERLTLAELSRRVGFPVLEPTYLPPGYVLQGGSVQRRGRHGFEAAELRYTDGLRLLSVSQAVPGAVLPGGFDEGRGRGPDRGRRGGREHRRGRGGERGRGLGLGPPGGDAVTLLDRGSEKVVRHFTRDRIIIVVGDLASDDLVKIATSGFRETK